MKRARSPDIVENPFIKQQNRSWRLQPTPSLREGISPPPARKTKPDEEPPATTTAAVEAGTVHVNDHVAFWGAKLSNFTRPSRHGLPQLSKDEWLDIYQRNQHKNGHHFVVHQHDHPVAGTHYDLRLQCNATSSISFAIMYGLPGDPNSRHLNRNATETRVHNLWVCFMINVFLLQHDSARFNLLSFVVSPQPPSTLTMNPEPLNRDSIALDR